MNKRVPMFGICGGCKAYGIDVIFFKNKYYPVQKVIVCPITASRLVSSICSTSLVWKFQKVIVCPFTAPALQSNDVKNCLPNRFLIPPYKKYVVYFVIILL